MAKTIRAPKSPAAPKAARKPKQTKAEIRAELRSNVTDETIQQCYEKSLAAKVAHEEVMKTAKEKNALFRKTLDDAKKLGVDPGDITWRLGQRFRDPKEIDAETQRRNRIAKLTNLPVGTQLGIFEHGVTVATAIEDGKAEEQQLNAEADLDQSQELGKRAGLAGKPASDNPNEDGSPEYLRWSAGWREGQAENMRPLAGKQNGSSAGAAAH
jgi:ribosome modulation factor